MIHVSFPARNVALDLAVKLCRKECDKQAIELGRELSTNDIHIIVRNRMVVLTEEEHNYVVDKIINGVCIPA